MCIWLTDENKYKSQRAYDLQIKTNTNHKEHMTYRWKQIQITMSIWLTDENKYKSQWVAEHNTLVIVAEILHRKKQSGN